MSVLSPFGSHPQSFSTSQVLVMRSIAGLYWAFLFIVRLGHIKILFKIFLLVVFTLFQVIFVDVKCAYECVWFLTLPGFFRGNFEDKLLLDIYFFFSNLLSLESKGKSDLFLHWLYLYVTNKRYFVQLLG